MLLPKQDAKEVQTEEAKVAASAKARERIVENEEQAAARVSHLSSLQ